LERDISGLLALGLRSDRRNPDGFSKVKGIPRVEAREMTSLSPNPRLQRTSPASPSPPLSRQPLGSRKRRGLVTHGLTLMMAACSQTRPPVARPRARAESSELLFRIRLALSEPPVDLSGVDVSLVAADGRIVPIGKSFDGRVRLPKAKIRELQATVILFSSPYTFSGAVLISQGDLSILDFDEYYLELAQLVVR
jgi:hypothetical protein